MASALVDPGIAHSKVPPSRRAEEHGGIWGQKGSHQMLLWVQSKKGMDDFFPKLVVSEFFLPHLTSLLPTPKLGHNLNKQGRGSGTPEQSQRAYSVFLFHLKFVLK